jgi:hypothetical protein
MGGTWRLAYLVPSLVVTEHLQMVDLLALSCSTGTLVGHACRLPEGQWTRRPMLTRG